MKKYYFLYNVGHDDHEDKQVEDLKYYLKGEIIERDYALYGVQIEKGKSVWVTEKYYILAHSLFNFEFMRNEVGLEDDKYTVEVAEEWFESYKDTFVLQ